MILKINNQSIPIQNVYFREFGFGENFHSHRVDSYLLTLSDGVIS